MKKLLFVLATLVSTFLQAQSTKEEYVQEFLNSPYMDTLIGTRAHYSLNIKSHLLRTGGGQLSSAYSDFISTPKETDSEFTTFFVENGLDTTLMYDQHAMVLAAYLKFFLFT